VVSAYRDGGWSADAIAEVWPHTLGPVAQQVGIPAPRVPEP